MMGDFGIIVLNRLIILHNTFIRQSWYFKSLLITRILHGHHNGLLKYVCIVIRPSFLCKSATIIISLCLRREYCHYRGRDNSSNIYIYLLYLNSDVIYNGQDNGNIPLEDVIYNYLS